MSPGPRSNVKSTAANRNPTRRLERSDVVKAKFEKAKAVGFLSAALPPAGGLSAGIMLGLKFG
jgi:hypothetical protein